MRHAQRERITTCGSGHFLLGAFHRLHRRWQDAAPGLGARELVAKALDGVYGVDINPFAVAIARFRLLVAAMHAAGDTTIELDIGYEPHLTAGDSLLWGSRKQVLDDDMLGLGIQPDPTEDPDALRAILRREHDVVVGNPPYITPKDPARNASYRELYTTPHRQYALSVPFIELIFGLAYGPGRARPAGWTGQITSNSFMKRRFGSKLIEEFLPTVDLQFVIDSEGAWIPGHNMDGTPTTMLFGRNRPPLRSVVRAILSMGVRETPADAAAAGYGPYWASIIEHIEDVGHEDLYISVSDLNRSQLTSHPWTLSGGGAIALAEHLVGASAANIRDRVLRVGFQAMSHADEEFTRPNSWAARTKCDRSMWQSLAVGTDVRDYSVESPDITWFPYSAGELLRDNNVIQSASSLWSVRTTLGSRMTFGGVTYRSAGRTWYEWHQVPKDADASPLAISFAEIASHNHFTLQRGGKVFNQTAPVIKLHASASIKDHLQLLGVLNSSIMCFWLRQKSQPKGGAAEHSWLRTYQFTGTTLKDFPLPATTPLECPQVLDSLARELQQQSPAELANRETPTAAALDWARSESDRLRRLMIAHQEELDWEYYRIYGLIDEDLTYTGELPGIALGVRTFEIALARRMRDGEHTAWFERHGSTPLTEIPDQLPADYRDLLQRRLDAIEKSPNIRLLERPEYKRRWASEPWDQQVQSALRGWLLDRIEDKSLWFDRDGRPTPQSVAQLADILDRDANFQSVLQLWAGDSNISTGVALAKLIAEESVPFLAPFRYKPAGLDKRATWEDTWALQRREDSGEKLADSIPVPQKYKSTDFAKPAYWSHRGSLDVPTERFIGYPGAGRDTDSTELLGWAGWDHADQALALASLISQRIEDGWDAGKLTPMLAGLHELAPWVRQWHSEIDPEYGESVADTVDAELTTRLNEYHLTVTDLTSWRPAPTTRGRKTKKS